MKRRIRTLNDILQAGSLMTVPEVARTLAVSIPLVYQFARDGKLPYIKVSDTGLRFDPSEVLDFIDDRRQGRVVKGYRTPTPAPDPNVAPPPHAPPPRPPK